MIGSLDDARIGLLGYGRWGSNWARVLDDAGALAWIVDPDYAARHRAKSKYPDVQVHEELPLWDLRSVTGVVDAAPPENRTDSAVPVLEEGVPVLVEKPFALTREDAAELVRASSDGGARLMVDHTFLHSQTVAVAVAWATERVGRIRHSHYVWTNVRTSRKEDALWNLGPHPLSIAGLILDIRDVQARRFDQVVASATRRPGKADSVVMARSTVDGTVETFRLSNFGPEKVREFTIVGEEGSIVCRPTQNEVIWQSAQGECETYMKQDPEPLLIALKRFINGGGDDHGREGQRLTEQILDVAEFIESNAGEETV